MWGKLNHRPYTKQETVQRRLAQLFKRHPARHFLEVSLNASMEKLRDSLDYPSSNGVEFARHLVPHYQHGSI